MTAPPVAGGRHQRLATHERNPKWKAVPLRIDMSMCINCDACLRHCPDQFDHLAPGRLTRLRPAPRGRLGDRGEPGQRVGDVRAERLQPPEQHVAFAVVGAIHLMPVAPVFVPETLSRL